MEPNRQRAFNLFFQTGLTQQQIADLLDIDRWTLYRWMKDGGWKRAKYAASHAPSVLIEQYYEQLGQLNLNIARRTDSPYPTKDESEVIRRLTMAIKHMRNGKRTVSESVEVFQAFTDRMRGTDVNLLKQIMPHLDKHIKILSGQGELFEFNSVRKEEAAFDKEYEEWLAAEEQKGAAAWPAEASAKEGSPIEASAKEEPPAEALAKEESPAENASKEEPPAETSSKEGLPNPQCSIPNSENIPDSQNDNGTSNGTFENDETVSKPLPGNTSSENGDTGSSTKNNDQQDNLSLDPEKETEG